MIFESLYIRSFGKVQNCRIHLASGLNIVEGANESGKSTIARFIRFMFYGLPQKTEDKLHDISWDTATAGGTLTLLDGDKHYRIEREAVELQSDDNKYSFRDHVAIYDADTNMAINKGVSPGEFFFGVSPSVFENTAYIRQSKESKIGGAAVSEEAENILFSGNESINTQKAIDKLDSARVLLLHKNRKGGKVADMISKRDSIAGELENAKKASGDIIYLEGTHRQITEKKEAAEVRLTEVNAELAEYDKYIVKQKYLRRKEEKQRLADMQAKIEAMRHDEAHGGIDIASDAYIASLEKRKNDLALASSRYRDAEEDLQAATKKLDEMSEKLTIFEQFGAKGAKTREELIKKTHRINEKLAKLKMQASLLFAAAVIFAVAGAVMMLLPESPAYIAYILFGICPIFLIAGLVLVIKMGGLRKDLHAICSRFNCKSYGEFEELVRVATRDEAFMVFITGERDNKNDAFNEASEKLEETSSEILHKLQDDGFGFSDNTALSLGEAIDICRKVKTEIAKLESSASEVQKTVDSIAEELSVHSKDYLKEACTAVYDEESMANFPLRNKKRDRDFLVSAIASQTERLHQMEVDLSALLAVNPRPTELAEQKAVLDEQIETLTKKWNAYMLAIDSIEKASGKLREGISPKIAANASKIMNAMTEGKYNTLACDIDFGLAYSDNGITRDADALSAGTGDLAYICLRIALMELLYTKSLPPFIFDESFAYMDDDRLKNVLTLLKKYADRGQQSLIFTCHKREKEIMSGIGKAYALSI